MAIINPYLIFEGKTEQAFNFYKSVFGGEFETLKRMKDMPKSPFQFTNEEAEWILHVALPIGPQNLLMGSDVISAAGQKVHMGDNVQISLNVDSEEEARQLFDGLSAGGQIEMPLDNTFWGALFGSFTDQFGIKWMVNYQHTLPSEF